MAPIVLADGPLAELKAAVAAENELTVDLESMEITHPNGLRVPFELDEYSRETLLHGLDDIARTLKLEDEIAAFEHAHTPRFATTLST
jgi:3-isopropylmalate/(R)-2-methylmalate dehydratase small subunit